MQRTERSAKINGAIRQAAAIVATGASVAEALAQVCAQDAWIADWYTRKQRSGRDTEVKIIVAHEARKRVTLRIEYASMQDFVTSLREESSWATRADAERYLEGVSARKSIAYWIISTVSGKRLASGRSV